MHFHAALLRTIAAMIQAARTVLASQPFSAFLGTEVSSCERGATDLRLPITERVTQQYGFVHGGVVSYMADNALTFTGGSVLGPQVVTSEYKISYLRPAKGRALIARARLVHGGRNLAVSECRVFAVDADGAERLCAIALGSVMRLPEVNQ